MKKVILITLLILLPKVSKADLWGGDLPLLAQIVFNTLHTMMELQEQTSLLNDEMAGINDRINRVQTIATLVDPSSWDRWKDPNEAVSRLQRIYRTMPKEFRNEKYDELDSEITDSMNMTARVHEQTATSHRSGQELERRGADASPGVAQKLTASGVGSLVSVQAQSLALQSHITKMLAQMMAQANERETRSVVTRGVSFASVTEHFDNKFSDIALMRGRF